MTKEEARDLFAMNAPYLSPKDFLPLQVQTARTEQGTSRLVWIDESEAQRLARWSYQYADAMLERSRRHFS